MTITMRNYGLTWTDADGVAHASAVAYDKPSGERQKQTLQDAGCTDVKRSSREHCRIRSREALAGPHRFRARPLMAIRENGQGRSSPHLVGS
ncbi:hypothetical protein ACF1BE_31160 [Streptomyces sp. NPDC014991]|uniref:hypothetical protein n=1 Tax=Streptomyces sp. NPDC014991 TaxID=3364935 RepID=UPI0036F9CC1C